MIALDDDDKDEIVRLMKMAGFRSRQMDPGAICYVDWKCWPI